MRHRFVLLAVVAACLFIALPASAAPKDAQAEKAYNQAMNEEYLDSKFDEAQKRVDAALSTCGDSGCSPKVKAKLFMAKGVILGGGKHKNDDAKAAFVEGLKLDSGATPDPDYMTSELKTAFEDAQKIAKKSGPGPGPSSGGGPLSSNSPPEQKLNTPVPIYIELDDDTAKKVTSVSLSYIPSNESTSRRQKMEKAGKAFRGQIPCTATAKKGQVQYWVTAKDKDDVVVATLGSEDEPLTVEIKPKLEGDPPSWPGFPPPDACAGGATTDNTDLRAKSSLRQCVDTADCPTNEKCTNNECLLQGDGSDTGSDTTSSPTPDGKAKKHRHWISLTFMPDLDVVSGDSVCSKSGQADDHFTCLRQPGVGGSSDYTVYRGTPTAGKGNNINTGIGVGQMRLMLGYDGVIADNFSLGLRVGYSFLGSPSPAKYFPAHIEGRAQYAFGSNAYTTAIARPWVELFGGAAQFDSAVEVQVLEDGEACGADPNDPSGPCEPDYGKAGGDDGNTRLQTLTAIKQAGLGFIGGGVGVSLMPAKFFAINIGFRFTATVPVFVPVLSPVVGIAIGP
jgi:hypothetical protein